MPIYFITGFSQVIGAITYAFFLNKVSLATEYAMNFQQIVAEKYKDIVNIKSLCLLR